jgi:hypothetical protein
MQFDQFTVALLVLRPDAPNHPGRWVLHSRLPSGRTGITGR